MLRLADRESRAIRREGAFWGGALSEMIQGGAESLSEKREKAISSFRRAESLFSTAGMLLHCANRSSFSGPPGYECR